MSERLPYQLTDCRSIQSKTDFYSDGLKSRWDPDELEQSRADVIERLLTARNRFVLRHQDLMLTALGVEICRPSPSARPESRCAFEPRAADALLSDHQFNGIGGSSLYGSSTTGSRMQTRCGPWMLELVGLSQVNAAPKSLYGQS